MGEIGYNTIMNEPFSEEVGSAKPRRRIKLASWLVLLLLPIALILPSFAENLRIAVIGRETVCCDPDNRGELEKKAEAARANREQADLIMRVGLIGGMVLAGVGAIGFLMAVVRFLPGLLKIVFGLVAIVTAGYIIYASYRMYDYYTNNTESYYETDSWYGVRDLEWYLPTAWFGEGEGDV